MQKEKENFKTLMTGDGFFLPYPEAIWIRSLPIRSCHSQSGQVMNNGKRNENSKTLIMTGGGFFFCLSLKHVANIPVVLVTLNKIKL